MTPSRHGRHETVGAAGTRTSGFTLIEVMGALVVLAAGVLIVLQITGSLAAQMENSATRSHVVRVGQERLDSLEALPFASLVTGTTTESIQIRGQPFVREVEITQEDILHITVEVSVEPETPPGPTFEATAYVARETW